MLVLTRKKDESITIGKDITVSILDVKGNQVKIGINAARNIPVYRTEIYESIMMENIKASASPDDLEMLQNTMEVKSS